MGKGTKKKTVWRTFSFENGYTNGINDADTNGNTAHHYHKDGLDNSSHDVSSQSSINNQKFAVNWREQRCYDDENNTGTKLNGNINGSNENGSRAFYKRTPLADKYPLRSNGVRKTSSHFQENGNKSDFHDIHENSSIDSSSPYRSNRSMKQSFTRHTSQRKKWDNQNGNYNSNGILSNYSRSARKSHVDHQNEHFNENGVVKNVRNADESDKCQDKANGYKSTAQERPDQHHSCQLNKFNEDEYTRISTPRSEVLFKKGYLMREKKYVEPTNTMSTTGTSSNDSGSVSVVSNEETASYYSIQSMSPDNSIYHNGNNSVDSNSVTYPNDGYERELSLIYSSGFYDNNGYFYVNPYIQNNFDHFNGPTILMPYGSVPTKDVDAYEADVFTVEPLSPITGDSKSVDREHARNCNSVNSEEMSNSSLSENVSINNDIDTPSNPLTPPPSPLSPSEKSIAFSKAPDSESTSQEQLSQEQLSQEQLTQEQLSQEKSSQEQLSQEQSSQEQSHDLEKSTTDECIVENGVLHGTDTPINAQDDQKNTETLSAKKDELPEEEILPNEDSVIPENYTMPYFSPFIYVPPIPYVPDARLSGARRGKFRRHNNYFGRPKRNNRFPHFYNKVFIPTNWSEAPDEMAPNITTDEEVIEPKLSVQNTVETVLTPTIEQCDKILQNSKLNLNVSEFIPQSKRMIFVPLSLTPSPPPASFYFIPIPSTESTLNVNVPEFLPKNYKPLNATVTMANDDQNVNQNDDKKIQMASSTIVNGNDRIITTIDTNDTNVEDLNEMTNEHRNGLSNNNIEQCMEKSANDNQHKQNDVNNDKNDKHQTDNTSLTMTTKQNGITVTMSDLLKMNNDNNHNLDACSFNNENSHTNLKADLVNKNVTNNIVKNKIYKMNNNNCNDNGRNKCSKINTSNKNAKKKHAYPKTKGATAAKVVENIATANKIVVDAKNTDELANVKNEKSMEMNPTGMTYAQMVVPIKLNESKSSASAEVKNATEMLPANKVMTDHLKSRKSLSNGKSLQNQTSSMKYGRRNQLMRKKSQKSIEIVEKPIESIEWFTIGAKGKKHIASNDSTVAEITFVHETTEEKLNKIAEELQLDINKDSDLALDIMDSLTVMEDNKSKGIAVQASKKKKFSKTNSNKTKKKPSKDKINKEQKYDTFDIIEPNFNDNKMSKIKNEISTEDEKMAKIEINESNVIESKTNNPIKIEESIVFDPNVFATPCNLQMDSVKRSTTRQSALRLSTGNLSRNLINQFDIYQPDYTSIANQQLKQDEEMVIKILQELNKSFGEHEMLQNDSKNETLENIEDVSAQLQPNIDNDSDAQENSLERFAINAKPYQNVYASNHFLEHSFGDRNDISDQVVISTDLSSSDQSYVEDENENICNNFDTYPVIAVDTEEEHETQQKITFYEYEHNGNADVSEFDGDKLNVSECEKMNEVEKTIAVESKENETIFNDMIEIDHFYGAKGKIAIDIELNAENQGENLFETETETETDIVTDQKSKHLFNETIETKDFNETEHKLPSDYKFEIEIENMNDIKVKQLVNEDTVVKKQIEDKTIDKLEPKSQAKAFEIANENDNAMESMISIDEAKILTAMGSTKVEFDEKIDEPFVCHESNASIDSQQMFYPSNCIQQNKSIPIDFNESAIEKSESTIKIDIHSYSKDEQNKGNILIETEPESVALETETISVESDVHDEASTVSCNESIISNGSNHFRPWLRIVDTKQLQQQKILQQTFPITTAVSMWLNQVQKEKTPEPIFRVSDYRFITNATKYRKQESQRSHSNSSIDLTDDLTGGNDRFHINEDDEDEEDIMNFWESPTLQTSQSPTPPPIYNYNSVYGSSINYANLLSNKNELLCNNIIDYDASLSSSIGKECAKTEKYQNPTENMPKTGIDEKCHRPSSEVCCTIM